MSRHTSIPVAGQEIEIINMSPLAYSPLISKCQIKVCYVGDEPNRNRSVITKEVAEKMAPSLRGCPIVGYYNEIEGDFEEHNREIHISNGKFITKDTTRPYGFIDLGAKIWFEKFIDDDQVVREYMVTEGYLWTASYPEAQRIIDKGNNQSMELNNKFIDAYWTKDDNGKPKFFIINEAIMEKLCILGEDCEPCFEGANITKVQFSLEDSFKNELYSMMNELKDAMDKGGTQVFTTYAVKVGDSLWTALYSFMQEKEYASIEAVLVDGERNFAVLKDKENKTYSLDFSVAEDGAIQLAEDVVSMDDYTPAEEPQFALADIEAFEVEYKKKDDNEGKTEKTEDPENDNKSEGKKPNDDGSKKEEEDDDDDKDDKKKKKNEYSLDEIPEYVALTAKYSELETKYNALVAAQDAVNTELNSLREFKLATEKVEKENMIKKFYMLSDEDKKDVIDNINTYSLDEIEAKLSVICVRNKVNFADFEDDNDEQEDPTTYNLGGKLFQDDSVPAWVKAVLETQNELK